MPGFAISPLSTPAGDLIATQSEYVYNYNWKVNNLFDEEIGPDSAVIHLKDATLPTFTVNRDQIIGGSLEYKYAKSVSWDDVRLSWYDTVKMSSIMKKWRNSVWTPEDGLKTGQNYKKKSIITIMKSDGSTGTEWWLYNSWPAVIREGDLTYTSSDIKVVEVTLSYDWAESFQS